MRRFRWGMLGIGAILVMGAGPVQAQFQPEKYALTAEERQQLTQGRDHLRQRLADLRAHPNPTFRSRPDLLPDVEIFLDAVDRNLAQDLFFAKGNVGQALACLKEGEARADALQAGKAPWLEQMGVVVLGYRSQIDNSVQPYQAYIPTGYVFAHPQPLRLDLFLHGRGGNLNEVAFLRGTGWVKGNFGSEPLTGFALYPYGRGNNGWRYAGERDVFEALADFKRRYTVDPNQTTLRGFSMGGHGVWHIGLQHPDVWAVMSPGAGFVETKRYHNLKGVLPDWQESLLHLYDPLDYAANGKDLPILHYVGETDTFYAQHQIMDAMLKQENVPYKEFIGPQTGHRYEPKTLQTLLAELTPLRREPEAPNVDFVTYTLRFPECKWVRLTGLEHHWQRAEIHAHRTAPDRIEVTTQNVSAFELTPSAWNAKGAIKIDGKLLTTLQRASLSPQTTAMAFVKRGGDWIPGEVRGLHKKPGLQGPIDDAYFGPTLAVVGTGTAWNAAADAWAKQELGVFREGWGRYCRATLPETTDASLTSADIHDKNLVLFGDPGSNSVLRRLLPKLPLHWTKDTITVAGKTFSAHDHLPALIFPNPENPQRYVVLNIGFTFSRADMDGSNSQQYPHLPDFAVLKIAPDAYTDDRAKNTKLAGFFDENWQAPHLP
ncbi:MAG: hypothetical protein JWL77_1085 [Chthonomonadaceae bacterium]|nr:hypothetical protein [Chthonomonadaceae bacterium]